MSHNLKSSTLSILMYGGIFMAAASIWFEILGVMDPGKNKFDFSRQISEKFQFFSGNFTKNFDFTGKNWPFTATSGQIILFLFKSHHF